MMKLVFPMYFCFFISTEIKLIGEIPVKIKASSLIFNASWDIILGATSIEKITKISASGRNFLDPLPPLFEKGPTDENVGISYLIVIIKFGFFEIFTPPPPISSESRTSPIFTIEVAPNNTQNRVEKKGGNFWSMTSKSPNGKMN